MRILYLIIFTTFLFLVPKTIRAQKMIGDIVYKASVPKSFSLLKKQKGVKTSEAVKNTTISLDNAIKKNIGKISYKLVFNENEAHYKLNSTLGSDEGFGIEAAKIATGAFSSYYFNIPNNQVLKQTEAYGQLFLISSDLNARKWILTQESKTIGSYLCYKATSTLVTKNSVGTFYKPVIAWYAPKLPVPYGPNGYGGLPGLIMQLKERNITFYVSKLTLNPKKEIKIRRPTKGKKVTQEEFEKIGEKSKLNFVKMRN